MAAMETEHVINVTANTDEVAGKARIIAKHLNAMADELEQFRDSGERSPRGFQPAAQIMEQAGIKPENVL